jgi:hypothetical protein
MIKIMVIPQSSAFQDFDVHHGLLCYRSPYFARICESRRGQKGYTIRFENQEPAIFALFLEWLYDKNFEYPIKEPISDRDGVIYTPLIKLWLLSLRIEVPELANAVVAKILTVPQKSGTPLPSPRSIEFLYTRTRDNEEGKQLRSLFVQLFAWHTKPGEIFCGESLQQCAQFVADVATRLAELKQPTNAHATEPEASDFRFKPNKSNKVASKIIIEISDTDEELEKGDDGVIISARSNFLPFFFMFCKEVLLSY